MDDHTDHAAHLDRSRRVWDRWSNWYGMSERDFAPLRQELIDGLGLEAGDRVLDVGCGPGVNLAPLRAAVGDEGHVTAVDYSPEMVAKARERIDDHGWSNVEVDQLDATTGDLGDGVDAAVATLSLSVMPDVDGAIENVVDAIEPGGQLAVLDVGPAPEGPARLANPLVRRFLRWYANWNPAGDVEASLDAVAEETLNHDRHMAGYVFTTTIVV